MPRALVSVSDKTNLVEFIKPLAAQGYQIVSTGGTSKFLREHQIAVTEVAEVTGFPEVMDGRVRTLHPKIHMGLLARTHLAEDRETLKKFETEVFDLVVVNLYPFEKALAKGLEGPELIEQIDIGGPSLLRAASKNADRIVVLCDPSDYIEAATKLKEHQASDESLKQWRWRLAAKVFDHCSKYDRVIAQALAAQETAASTPRSIELTPVQVLRYGENPHQKAQWFDIPGDGPRLSRARIVQGKELSYNNLLDLDAATRVALSWEGSVSVIVKHLTPCGVALGDDPAEAFERALNGDPVSAFGGIIAFNRSVNARAAEKIAAAFYECVIAPAFDEAALAVFAKKKNLRVLEWKDLKNASMRLNEPGQWRSIWGGLLYQTSDGEADAPQAYETVGQKIPDHILSEMEFAQMIVRHVKSNAIVVTQGLRTLGVGGGQTNRVDAVRQALERAQERCQKLGLRMSDCVLASDAFFPFRDSIDLASGFGVKWVIQPGGSLRDAEVKLAVQELKMGMILTGRRHFKH